MRIGFDAKRLYGNFTGLGNYSRSLLKNIRTQYPEHDYHLYTPRVKQSPETDCFFHSADYHTYQSKAWLKSWWRSFAITQQLQQDHIQLYHGLSHELPFRLRQAGIRSVVTIHDLIFKVYPRTYAAIDRKIYDFKFKDSCLRADRIVAISHSTKRDIIRFYGIESGKIEVVYQSCDPLYYQSDDVQAETIPLIDAIPKEYLLFVGSIQERKNLPLLIDAYRYLPSDTQIPLVVVGKGSKYQPEMKKRIQASGIEHLVFWMDTVTDNHHLRRLYQNAMALVYPSLYEGFGLPVVEALLSKTPVITSNVSSLLEAGGPHAVYVDPHQPEELAQAIQTVLGDTALRKEMKAQGYTYAVANFSPAVVTEQMMHLYENTLADRYGK